jgi:hypothetical protein
MEVAVKRKTNTKEASERGETDGIRTEPTDL